MIAVAAPLESLAQRRGRLTVVVATLGVLVALALGTTPAVSLPSVPFPGIVVFGLAARRGSDRPTDIERLTDELRGFVSRLEDADPTADGGSLPTEPDLADVGRDRDDEIGRLSAAVDELASTVRDRERQRAESERYRRELARITSDPEPGTETKIRRLLELGCERLGLETGLVSHIDEPADRYEVETAVGTGADLEGAVLDLSETHCRNAVTSDDVVGISETPAADTEAGAAVESDVGCYIGGKILVDGDLYGTVCFVGSEPRDRSFSPAERSFVDLLARWVSGAFERREYVAAIEERERRLERTQAFTDDMLDAVDDVVYLLEEDGDLRRWNETLVDVTGYSDAAVAEMNALDFFDAENEGAIRESMRDAFETGETRVEAELRTKSGERIPYEFIASVLEDPNGNPIEVGIGRDISDRRERERRLERTTSLLEQSQRLADVGAWELDVSTEPYALQWTTEIRRILGVPPDEPIDLEASIEFYHPEDRPRIREAIERAIADGEPYDLELRARTADDDLRWVRSIGEPVREDGEIVTLRGSFQDITDRKKRERDLERAETVLQALDELVYTIDEDGEFTFLNDAIEGITGYEADDLIGENVSTVMDEADLETARDRIRDLRSAGEPTRTFEMDLETVDGDVIDAENHMALLPSEDGEFAGTAGVVRDITDRKERERDLERFEAIVQALDELVYTLDDEGRFTYLNDAAKPILGYEPAELLGEPAATVIPSPDVERAQDRIRDLLRSDEPSQTVEIVLETADGEVIDVENHIALLPGDDGEFVGTAGVVRDITARKERERRLETTRARLEALFENSPDMIDVLDPAGTIVDGNRRFYDELGYDESDLLGTKIWDHDDRFDADEVSALLAEMAVGERRRFEGRYRRRDDSTFPVEVHLIRLDIVEDNRYLAITRDITDRKERERDLRETKRRLELALEGTNTGVWEWDLDSDTVAWNETLERLVGLDPGAFEGTFDAFRERLHPDDVGRIETMAQRAIENDTLFQTEFRLRHEDGSRIWVGARGRLVDDEAGQRLVGINNDITDRKERELALESLHDAARNLLGTDTEAEVSALVVETAVEVIEASGAAVYRLDPAVNRLVPAASTEAFDRLCNDAPSVPIGDGESALWNTYVTGTGTVVDDPSSFDRSRLFGPAVESGVVVPIGDYGVFAVATDAEPIDAEARRLIETLVATTEAAFDRLESEASLREREAQLERRNERLNRQIETTELIRRIDQVLIGAESRGEIERTVPERLLEADSVALAWIGDRDPSGTRLEPRAWAGDGEAYLDDVSLADDAAEPAVRTAADGTPTVVSNVVEGLQNDPWRRQAVDRGFQSVISVPLSHAEYSYGVLTVYADEPEAFGDLERTVLTELGEGIANAITAMKTREALHAERLLELTLRIDDDEDLLSRLAAKTGASIEYAGLGSHASDETLLFVETDGVAPDDVRSALADLVSVTDARLISETDGTCRFEATVTGDPLAARLVRHGGSPRSIRTDGEGLEVVVDVPTGTDVREFVETLEEGRGAVELRARRHVERSMGTRSELVTSLFDALTDRQLEVLRTAYFAGFFEWPRESTGEEIAEMLAVTQPTVNRHLRLAQGRLLAQLFEDRVPVAPS
ncbi:histidine kinase [Natrinema saccharevitans]|uniref:histidine kinase n=1 Tax=Natrinema saccharevitans TaxID=301967 RepID=A0A1S8B0D2_9EURY|nr:PAS domain S-box protein [Natrinema saccharevitans]OLZ42490.1 histidine kinase [Natrinema saccharevitans]